MRQGQFPWMPGAVVTAAWAARVYTEAVAVAERQLVYARLQGRMYSSYAAMAERLERELEVLKRLKSSPPNHS